MTEHSLKGKTVLIAGGAKNLGGLIARDFAAQGAKAIVIHYNSAATQADAEATVAAVQVAGSKAVALQGDLTSAAAMGACSPMPWPQSAVPTSPSIRSARY